MSIISQAAHEMELIGFDPEEKKAMLEILSKFFATWDSGGAVWAVAPILQRLIAGKCLSPLTGEYVEWMHVGEDTYQNIRCGSVFWNKKLGIMYDIDNPKGPREPITFTYWPEKAEVGSPVVEIEV